MIARIVGVFTLCAFARGAGAQPAGAAGTPTDGAPAEPPATATAEPTPPVAPPEAPPKSGTPVEVVYDKGFKLTAADGKFEMTINAGAQLRWESVRSLEDGSEFEQRFLVPRSRVTLSGFALSKGLRYKLQVSLSDRGSFSALKDAVVDKRIGAAWFRIGQFKRPFIRQWITSYPNTQFNERSVAVAFAGNGRDIGAAIHNDYEKTPEGIEWVAGVFNSFSGGGDVPKLKTTCTQDMAGAITCTTGTPTNIPTDYAPALVARVAYNVGKIKGYTEGDADGGPLRFSIGLGYKLDLAQFAKPIGDNLSHGIELEGLAKVSGFSLAAAAYIMKLKTADAQLGFHVQSGFFVSPKKIEVAGRFAMVPAGGDRKQLEIRGALNYIFAGTTKWATDIGMLQLTGNDPMTMTSSKPDLELRTMLQVVL